MPTTDYNTCVGSVLCLRLCRELSFYGGLNPGNFQRMKLSDVKTLNGAALCWSYWLGVIVDQYVTLNKTNKVYGEGISL